MDTEPSYPEIFLTRLAFCFCGRDIYGEYADRLPLLGNEEVLDFGCGMGTVAYYAAKRLPRGRLLCADISARWLAACRSTLRGYSNVAFFHGGIRDLVPPGEGFDLIYCHFVLHDIPEDELQKTLPSLAESLKPNGLLALREPLDDTGRLGAVQRLAEQCGLSREDSRVTDIPIMGNTLESIYRKTKGREQT